MVNRSASEQDELVKNERENLVTRFSWSRVCVVVLVFVGAMLFCGEVGAQGTKADYERAASLRKQTENKVFNRRIEPKWTKDGNAFWYRRQTGSTTFEYVWVDAVKGEKRPAFDHQKLAQGLSKQMKKEIGTGDLMLEQLEWTGDGKRMTFSTEGKKWSCDLTTYELKDEGGDGEGLEPDPDARASRRTGGETRLIFENKTMGAVELFWIDSDGKKQPYGRIGAGERRVQNTYAGHVWSVEPRDGGQEIARYTARELTSVVRVGEERKADAGRQRRGNRRRGAPREAEVKEEQRGQSPDGKWIVFVRNYNLFLKNRESGKESQLSFDGGLGEGYREEVSWAPDSKHLVGTSVTAGAEHKVYMVESSPADQLQPKLK